MSVRSLQRQQPYDALVEAPFGWIAVRMGPLAVESVDFLQQPSECQPTRGLARDAAKQIERYLSDPRFIFDLPIAASGTPYQQRVWGELLKLGPGETETYGSLAMRIGSGPRAVGGACRSNPIPLLVPCHRVVAKGGTGGFMGNITGPWRDVKSWLLAHEAKT